MLQLLIAGLSSHPKGQSISPSQIQLGSAQILGPSSAPHGMSLPEHVVSMAGCWKRININTKPENEHRIAWRISAYWTQKELREEVWLKSFDLYHSLSGTLPTHLSKGASILVSMLSTYGWGYYDNQSKANEHLMNRYSDSYSNSVVSHGHILQDAGSSEKSLHSLIPSQTQSLLIQSPEVLHLNSVSVQLAVGKIG